MTTSSLGPTFDESRKQSSNPTAHPLTAYSPPKPIAKCKDSTLAGDRDRDRDAARRTPKDDEWAQEVAALQAEQRHARVQRRVGSHLVVRSLQCGLSIHRSRDP